MKIVIISDVHGNLPALEHVLLLEKDADLIVSLGDVVNYGPWSNECVELLETVASKVLLKGNHETAFISGTYPGDHPVAKIFFDFCYPEFNRVDIIERYLIDFDYDNFNFVHTVDDAYVFPDTEVELTRNTFIGHSHRLFSRNIHGFQLVNVGSVGQNRANPDELNYVIWQPEKNALELVTKTFSADLLISKMKEKGYPEICIKYIAEKRKQK